MSAGGYIYAIGARGTALVEIGSTKRVEKRLKTLQTGQPFALQTLAAVHVETNVRRIERQVHAFLVTEHRRGECFEVPIDEERLTSLVQRAMVYLAEQDAPTTPTQTGMDHSLRQILGKRLHLARRRAGLSQVELATRAAISPTTLNRVELGRQKLYAETLVTLAQILDVRVDYLMGLSEDDGPPTRPPLRTAAAPVA